MNTILNILLYKCGNIKNYFSSNLSTQRKKIKITQNRAFFFCGKNVKKIVLGIVNTAFFEISYSQVWGLFVLCCIIPPINVNVSSQCHKGFKTLTLQCITNWSQMPIYTSSSKSLMYLKFWILFKKFKLPNFQIVVIILLSKNFL